MVLRLKYMRIKAKSVRNIPNIMTFPREPTDKVQYYLNCTPATLSFKMGEEHGKIFHAMYPPKALLVIQQTFSEERGTTTVFQ